MSSVPIPIGEEPQRRRSTPADARWLLEELAPRPPARRHRRESSRRRRAAWQLAVLVAAAVILWFAQLVGQLAALPSVLR